jgi:hypothetical protein
MYYLIIFFFCVLRSALLAEESNYNSDISPININQSNYVLIGTVSSKYDLAKENIFNSSEIVLELNVVKDLNGDLNGKNINFIINKKIIQDCLFLIDISSFKEKQDVLIVLDKKDDVFYLSKPGGWLIWPNNINQKIDKPLNSIISDVVASNGQIYKKEFERIITSELTESKYVDKNQGLHIKDNYLKLYDLQYASVKHNYGIDDISQEVQNILSKLNSSGHFIPCEAQFLLDHPDDKTLKAVLNAYKNNNLNEDSLRKLDFILKIIISKNSSKVIGDNFDRIETSGSKVAIASALSVLNNDVSVMPVEVYINILLHNGDERIKYHAYQCIFNYRVMNLPAYPSYNDFKKNPQLYIDQWTAFFNTRFKNAGDRTNSMSVGK